MMLRRERVVPSRNVFGRQSVDKKTEIDYIHEAGRTASFSRLLNVAIGGTLLILLWFLPFLQHHFWLVPNNRTETSLSRKGMDHLFQEVILAAADSGNEQTVDSGHDDVAEINDGINVDASNPTPDAAQSGEDDAVSHRESLSHTFLILGEEVGDAARVRRALVRKGKDRKSLQLLRREANAIFPKEPCLTLNQIKAGVPQLRLPVPQNEGDLQWGKNQTSK